MLVCKHGIALNQFSYAANGGKVAREKEKKKSLRTSL
jgi:hypothetical protein